MTDPQRLCDTCENSTNCELCEAYALPSQRLNPARPPPAPSKPPMQGLFRPFLAIVAFCSLLCGYVALLTWWLAIRSAKKVDDEAFPFERLDEEQ